MIYVDTSLIVSLLTVEPSTEAVTDCFPNSKKHL